MEFHFGFFVRIFILDFLDEKSKRDRMLFGIFVLDFLSGQKFPLWLLNCQKDTHNEFYNESREFTCRNDKNALKRKIQRF